MNKKIILTGDRPTGSLHLGHYVGSLQNRVLMQHDYKQFIILADMQALTDNYNKSYGIKESIFNVTCDYLAAGIDPSQSTIFIQSLIPEISHLCLLFMNLVTVARLQRNPTVKNEINQKNFGESIPVGFFNYPISQAADILAFHADYVPVGDDQIPMIEQTNEIARAFNRIYECSVFHDTEAIISKTSRLIGIDGKNKMSKSLDNAIYLSDTKDMIESKVKQMYTDANHLKVSDPGKVEGNVVFTYLDIFDPHTEEVTALKEQYQRGGLGDMVLKKRLMHVLEELIAPMREKRNHFVQNKKMIWDILHEGSLKAQKTVQETMMKVEEAMKIKYW